MRGQGQPFGTPDQAHRRRARRPRVGVQHVGRRGGHVHEVGKHSPQGRFRASVQVLEQGDPMAQDPSVLRERSCGALEHVPAPARPLAGGKGQVDTRRFREQLHANPGGVGPLENGGDVERLAPEALDLEPGGDPPVRRAAQGRRRAPIRAGQDLPVGGILVSHQDLSRVSRLGPAVVRGHRSPAGGPAGEAIREAGAPGRPRQLFLAVEGDVDQPSKRWDGSGYAFPADPERVGARLVRRHGDQVEVRHPVHRVLRRDASSH